MFFCKKNKTKWGVIVGHTEKAKGAISPKGLHEYTYNLKVAELTGLKYATRNDSGVSGAAYDLFQKGCTKSVEFHCNAYNGKVRGFELLCLMDDKKSFKEASEIVRQFRQAFPNRIIRHGNGILLIEKGDRGYNNLVKAKNNGMEIALIAEPFFLDNNLDYMNPNLLAEFWKKTLH